ncbi:CoxG family protein [Telmatospirillum sp. J64-1]|uniref:CoxG family protein n=1 Tax=Telmatospirillum sp. J64-1 TaxID=2502183 RepID=UPI00115D6444|nr:SRPBCC domain-containing protein [Telmatospirillum sp. J64-1]
MQTTLNPASTQDEVLSGERFFPVEQQILWHKLQDPAVIKAVVPGCRSAAKCGDEAFEVIISVPIGPFSKEVKGTFNIKTVEAPKQMIVEATASWGIAGTAKGSIDVYLTPLRDGTLVRYSCQLTLTGPMALYKLRRGRPVLQKLLDTAAGQLEVFLGNEGRSPVGPAAGARPLGPETAKFVLPKQGQRIAEPHQTSPILGSIGGAGATRVDKKIDGFSVSDRQRNADQTKFTPHQPTMLSRQSAEAEPSESGPVAVASPAAVAPASTTVDTATPQLVPASAVTILEPQKSLGVGWMLIGVLVGCGTTTVGFLLALLALR